MMDHIGADIREINWNFRWKFSYGGKNVPKLFIFLEFFFLPHTISTFFQIIADNTCILQFYIDLPMRSLCLYI